jgi:hypothetical protein
VFFSFEQTFSIVIKREAIIANCYFSPAAAAPLSFAPPAPELTPTGTAVSAGAASPWTGCGSRRLGLREGFIDRI